LVAQNTLKLASEVGRAFQPDKMAARNDRPTFLKLPLVFTALACSIPGSFILIKLRPPHPAFPEKPFDMFAHGYGYKLSSGTDEICVRYHNRSF
jgi:hypothetical protein